MRGTLEATSRATAIRELKDRSLVVMSLVAEERGSTFEIGFISVLEKVTLTKHLGIMLRAGVTLDESLRILEFQARGKLKQVLRRVRADVEAGKRLADALEAHPRVFNPYFVNMIRAGEESGNLVENLDALALRFGKDYELRQKALSAMFYPALVLTLTFSLGLIISLFVLPRLTSLFRAFDFELPWTTRLLIAASNFMVSYGLFVTVGLIGGIILVMWAARQRFMAPFMHWLYLHLPIVRNVSRTVNLARFSMVLGSLLKSGIPISLAIPITGNVLGNMAYRRVLTDISPRVDAGEPLSVTLEDSSLFPPFVTRMILVGEETGKLEEVLFYLAEFYESELDITLKNLSTVIEPLLLVTIGLIVAGVTLSIITPIYNFISVIG